MKTKIISMCIMIILLTIAFSGCSSDENNRESIKDLCVEYSSEYSVIEESDGAYLISVTAPDFSKISRLITDSNNDSNVDETELEKMVKQYPENIKEYEFLVENCETATVEKAFFDKVSYELAASAITNIEFEEGWDVEWLKK